MHSVQWSGGVHGCDGRLGLRFSVCNATLQPLSFKPLRYEC